jgi:outer membrane murein-binding lipoprotein Lpp
MDKHVFILGKTGFKKWLVEILCDIKTKGDNIMATVDELNAKLDAIPPVLDAIAADEQALKDMIAGLQANQPVSQAQLDEMTAKVDAVLSRVQGIDASV